MRTPLFYYLIFLLSSGCHLVAGPTNISCINPIIINVIKSDHGTYAEMSGRKLSLNELKQHLQLTINRFGDYDPILIAPESSIPTSDLYEVLMIVKSVSSKLFIVFPSNNTSLDVMTLLTSSNEINIDLMQLVPELKKRLSITPQGISFKHEKGEPAFHYPPPNVIIKVEQGS